MKMHHLATGIAAPLLMLRRGAVLSRSRLDRTNDLHGRHHLDGYRPWCLQRSWRRAKSGEVGRGRKHHGDCPCGECAGSGSRGAVRMHRLSAPTTCTDGTTSTATGRGACSGHGGVQKAAKAARPQAPRRLPLQRVRRQRPPRRRQHLQVGYHGAKDHCCEVGTGRRDGALRQYRPHRRHGQVQGRDLFEVQASHRDLLEARRRRQWLDGSQWRPAI